MAKLKDKLNALEEYLQGIRYGFLTLLEDKDRVCTMNTSEI